MSRCLLALMFALVVCAQESPPQYHFVVIVDTSISMADRKSAVLSAMRDLCRSSFSGQIEDGDVIDLWTCDTPKDGDPFNPLLWFTRRGGAISLRASEYISAKKFHRGGHIAEPIAELTPALPNTTGLMAILLTDGEEPISGFSFDSELNQEIAKLRREATKTKRPILVALSAVDGEWSDWKVKLGTDRLDLPKLPKREKPVPPAQQIAAKEATNVVEKAAEPEPPPPVVFNYPPGAKIMANVSPAIEPAETSHASAAPPQEPVKNLVQLIPTKVAAPVEEPHPSPATNSLKVVLPNGPLVESTQALAPAILSLTLPSNSVTTTPKSNIISVVTATVKDSHPATVQSPPIYLLASAGSICVLAAGLLVARRPNRSQKASIISRSLAK